MRGRDGVMRPNPATELGDDNVCGWCGGHHETICRDEHDFARQVKAADERLYGKPRQWGSGNAQGPQARAYRERGKLMTKRA